MLTAIELENFKAFGERTRIELAPITLVFGENSAGKSSILQALNLLKQTRESRDSGAVILPRSEDGIVELGGFQELVFDHDLKRDVSIRVDFMPEKDFKSRLPESKSTGGNSSEVVGFEVGFNRPTEKEDIQLKAITLYSSAASGKVAEFQPIELSHDKRDKLARDSQSLSRSHRPIRLTDISAAKCTSLTKDASFWSDIYERTKRRSVQIVEELRKLQTDGQNSDPQRSLFRETEDEKGEWLAQIDGAISFYESDFTSEVFIERMLRAELETVIGLDGFVPIPVRQRERGGLPELETFRRYGPSSIRMRDLTLNLMAFAVDCGRMLDVALENVYPMGPFRRPPERFYISTGTTPQNVGYRGDLLPDLLFRRPDVVKETNEWLDKLEIGYHITAQSVGEQSRDLFEVRLIDRRRGSGVDVALSDVGFGISQILPFIVQSLAGVRQIITIEQPEVHIHPRLQADLGDLLAATVQEPRNHRFVIETHSEHLVLRMQRLIREGRLTPDDVSILYVSRGANGSKVERLHLDESGDFIDDWPGGFFPERLRELT
jgi:predicted ATPase